MVFTVHFQGEALWHSSVLHVGNDVKVPFNNADSNESNNKLIIEKIW